MKFRNIKAADHQINHTLSLIFEVGWRLPLRQSQGAIGVSSAHSPILLVLA